jgi:hypothetical protein
MAKPVDFPELQAVLASLPVESSDDGACEKPAPTVHFDRSQWR